MAGLPFDAGYWKSTGSNAWVTLQPLLDRLYQPISEAILAGVPVAADARVLDIGCGPGATTLEMARRLTDGLCLGVDVSEPLLALAGRRARAEGLANADFMLADAQTAVFDSPFDALISRFGVMFFPDPEAAFANLRRALRPGGRLGFACWRGPDDNPLAGLPDAVARPLIPGLRTPPTSGPGRFAFADPGEVRDILVSAGWREVEIAPLDVPTPLSVAELVEMCLKLGPVGAAMPGLDENLQKQVHDAMIKRVEQEARDGVVPMTAACWLVTATA